jgi:O-antigen ligase
VAYALVQGVHELRALPGLAWLEQILTSNPGILSGSERLYLEGFTTIPRLRGTMCEPLYLGSYLVGVLPFLASQGRRRLALVATVVLLLTWSRGAWLAALVAGAVWWALRRRAGLAGPDRRVLAWLVGALLAGMVLVVLVAGPDALLWPGRRLAQTLDRTDWSNLTRLYSLQAAWRAFLHSPVVGVGWGQFPYHFYALVDLPGLQSQFTWPVVNNVPLLVLCETGLLGFLVLAGAAGTLLVATWRALARQADPARKARLAALAAGGCGLAAQLQFFSQYNLPHLWVVPGLWLAALAALPPSKMARRNM